MFSNCKSSPSPTSYESFASNQMATWKHSQDWTTQPSQPCKTQLPAAFQLTPLKNKTETIGKRWLKTAPLSQYSQHFHLTWFLWDCPLKVFCPLSEDKLDFFSAMLGYPRLLTVVINKILEWKFQSLHPRSSIWRTDNCTFKKRTGLSPNNKH